jgi:hypothetical protein
MNNFPNDVGCTEDEGFKSIIKAVDVGRLGSYLVFKASLFSLPFDGPTIEETRFDDVRDQTASISDDDELGEDQIAFLADLKTRLLEEKIIDGELSQNKEAQLKALRAFFDVITPVPPYKEREKIQGAIELLRRKIKSSKK